MRQPAAPRRLGHGLEGTAVALVINMIGLVAGMWSIEAAEPVVSVPTFVSFNSCGWPEDYLYPGSLTS